MGEVLRYDIYETSDRGMNIDIDQDGGEWVSYEDHAEEIATLRAQVTRRDEEVSDLRHEIESARDAARGENALRLEAERERDALRSGLEDHRAQHDDAKAAWEVACSERDIAEEKLEAAEREIRDDG